MADADFNDLPVEILLKIFSYLPMKDRRVLRMVSQNIKHIIDDKFLQECELKITEDNIRFITNHIENQSSNILWFRNIQLENIQSTRYVQFLLEKLGDQVIHLTMEKTAAFNCLKGNLKNLRSLKLYCDGTLEHNAHHLNLCEFPYLEHLEFMHNWCWADNITTRLLSQLLNKSNNMLRLKHFKICFTRQIETEVLNVLMYHSATMEYLDIYFSQSDEISDPSWEMVFKPMVNLKVFSFVGYKHFLNTVLTCLPPETQLERIKLNCCDVDDTLVNLITDKWSQSLKAIHLIEGWHILDTSLFEFRKVPQLKFLELSLCVKISCEALLNACHYQFMEELSLSYLPNLDETFLCEIVRRLPNLRTLKLIDLEKAVTNIALSEIFRHLTKLRILFLDYAVFTDEGLIGFGENPYSIKRLSVLEELSLLSCLKLSDRIFNEAIQFSELRYLDLRDISRIKFRGIEKLVQHCTSLKMLGISAGLANEENVLITIAKGLKSLRKLVISYQLGISVLVETKFFEMKRLNDNLFINCQIKTEH